MARGNVNNAQKYTNALLFINCKLKRLSSKLIAWVFVDFINLMYAAKVSWLHNGGMSIGRLCNEEEAEEEDAACNKR